MKIKFLEDGRVDDKVEFEKDSTHDLTDSSAHWWVRRGLAKYEESSIVEKAVESVKETAKDLAHKAADKLNDLADGADSKEDVVVKDESVVENTKNSKPSAKTSVKGL